MQHDPHDALPHDASGADCVPAGDCARFRDYLSVEAGGA